MFKNRSKKRSKKDIKKDKKSLIKFENQHLHNIRPQISIQRT